jgi:cytidylate kinase
LSRNVFQIVERQCRGWELQQDKRRKKPAAQLWPVILVSREFGARGEALAKSIGERVDFFVWDGQLVHAVAEESGANEAVLRSLDERRRRVIEDSIEGAFLGGAYMESEYLLGLMKLFHTIAEHGQGIIVGRGAEYVLPAETTFRMRVVSPLQEKVRSYAARHGIDEGQARREIEKGEQERLAFIRRNFFRKSFEPSDYDIIVNSGTLPFGRLVDVVLESYEAKFGRRPPTVPSPSRDSKLP